MKNSIKLFALAALLGLGGCHEPDELTPSVVDQGLNMFRRESASDSAGTVLSGGSVGIYQGRRVCRGYSQVHAYA